MQIDIYIVNQDIIKNFIFIFTQFFVAYVDNAFLNLCAVLVSTIFSISVRFCLLGIFSRCFAVPFFTNHNAPTTIGIIDVFNCYILSTSLYFDSFSYSLAEIFIFIGNVKSIILHVFFFVIFYSCVWFIFLYSSACVKREIP